MARRDRRFTGYDIARLYCRNLSDEQKQIAAYLFDHCGPMEFDEAILRALADYYTKETPKSLFFEALADLVSGGEDFVGGIIKYIKSLLGNDGDDPILIE